MIIISQEKNASISDNNIEVIYMIKKDSKMEIHVRGNYDYTVGKYKTEERAKEVLQEIIEFWRNGAMTDCKGFICYEMPEK